MDTIAEKTILETYLGGMTLPSEAEQQLMQEALNCILENMRPKPPMVSRPPSRLESSPCNCWPNRRPSATGQPIYKEHHIVTVMPFGKYKNRPLDEIPRGYLRWVLKNCQMSDSLHQAVECMVKALPLPPEPLSLEAELEAIMRKNKNKRGIANTHQDAINYPPAPSCHFIGSPVPSLEKVAGFGSCLAAFPRNKE